MKEELKLKLTELLKLSEELGDIIFEFEEENKLDEAQKIVSEYLKKPYYKIEDEFILD